LLWPPVASGGQFDRVREVIRKQMVEQQVPSVAVAVAREGKILWEEAFGWTDRENRIGATEHTMYSLASISKPFTATGLMVLRERGKIDLDRPMNEYLGEAKLKGRVENAAAATLRRVANHTSGLPLHYQFFYEDEPYRPPSMEETIRRYGNLITAPGEKYQYSNLGYGVLDYAISRVSGKSYADFMREEVFLPLGLTRTSIGIGAGLEKHHAIRYGPDRLPVPFYDFDHRGGSAVYSSAHDLVRFGMFHLKAHLPDQKAILPDQAIEEMQKPTAGEGRGGGYGIGWGINENMGGYRVVSHSGGMGGVTTILSLVPAEKLAVLVLTNTTSGIIGMVQREIFSVMLPKLTRPSPPAAGDGPRTPFRPPPELAGAWSGAVDTYNGEIPFTLTFLESGDVHARLGQQLKTLLNDVVFRDGYLTGRLMGDIGTEDANRRPYWLSVSLKLRGNVLNGGMTALSRPGRRAGNALTHWVEVKKQ
jgi:CubicO group peptidase (beta-lactamase class C family)